ncbi:sensor domain-containing diguanylate cyclase [candidate division TA06 bacterium]|uniref:Sensor domain-containing diguanylate cyclase n=1 Tax=candidate division TA06 bacterium TaxID=2250710 RepID=A0A933I6T5_UNCT6|nr:sensor domain-containing diguanylate cyclase [candidate division TA06 bacterium]
MNDKIQDINQEQRHLEVMSAWVRWAVLFLAALLTAAHPEQLGYSGLGLIIVLTGAAVYNLLIILASARIFDVLRRRSITLGFDLVFATLLIAFTGGSRSQFFYLYYLAVIWAALLGSRQGALKAAGASIVLYFAALAWRRELVREQLFLYDLLFKIGLLSLTAFWAGFISDQQKLWRSRHLELSRAADEWTRTVSNIHSAAMFGIGALISSSKDIEETLGLTLDAIEDIVKSDRCSILLLDFDTRELVLRAARGMRAGMVGKLRLQADQGIAGEVLKTGLPKNVPDTDLEPMFVPSPKGYDKIRSMLVFPLMVREKRMGVINISEVKGKREFTPSELSAIKLIADYAALALENAGIMEEKEREATTDGLTGLYNYRYFWEELVLLLKDEKQHPLSLIWMDLDHFKEYNDVFGHLKGSEILKRMGNIIGSVLAGQSPVICRYGGDEFAVILKNSDKGQTCRAAEAVRISIYRTEFSQTRPDGKKLSASLGVAVFPGDARDGRELVEKADQAMYFAKEQGKNRVACWASDKIILTGGFER